MTHRLFKKKLPHEQLPLDEMLLKHVRFSQRTIWFIVWKCLPILPFISICTWSHKETVDIVWIKNPLIINTCYMSSWFRSLHDGFYFRQMHYNSSIGQLDRKKFIWLLMQQNLSFDQHPKLWLIITCLSITKIQWHITPLSVCPTTWFGHIF